MVLQALSALMEPTTAQAVASCLIAAGCRESQLRAFSPQNVLTRLIRLAKAEFADRRTTATLNRNAFWICRPAAGEMALRHAVRDGLFTPLAQAAAGLTRGRDWRGEGTGESPGRRFRLAFHSGDWNAAAHEFKALLQQRPGRSGGFLANLTALQPDDSWRRGIDSPPFAGLLAAAIDDLALGLTAHPALGQLADELLERHGREAEWDGLVAAQVNLLTLRGKIPEAAKTAELAADPETRLTARLAPALASGGDDAAALAENGAGARRFRLGAKDILSPGGGAFWQILTALAGHSSDTANAMLHRLSSPALAGHPLAGAISCLRHALLFMTGQSFAAKAFNSSPPDERPLTALAHGLVMLRIHPEQLPDLAESLRGWERTAAMGGFHWLAFQFQWLANAGRRTKKPLPVGWLPLARLFRGDDEWRRNLAALDFLAGAPDVAGEERQKRVAWVIRFSEDPPNPSIPVEAYPVEQTLGKGGSWSKGRNIALRRIARNHPAVPHAADQDRLAFSALFPTMNRWDNEPRFNVPLLLSFLIGHPLVFRDAPDGPRIEVAAGEFELAISEADGGCKINLEPAAAEFMPRDRPWLRNEADSSGSGPPEAAIRLETPTRLRIFRLGEWERSLAKVIGDGLTIPPTGRETAIHTMAKLAGRIKIQSDLPELTIDGETVAADPLPRLHLIPRNPGLEVEIWSHPLGTAGPAWRPGLGGRMACETVAGRRLRTTRDHAMEKALAEAAAAACPSLAGSANGEMSWRLDDPVAALSFMAETEALAGKAELVWPKGGHFRVRKVSGQGGLSLRLRSADGWLEVEGSLQVDENLVVDMASLMASARKASTGFVPIGGGDYIRLTDDLRRQLGDLDALGELRDGRLRLPSLAGEALAGMEKAGLGLAADAEWRRTLERRQSLADFSPDPPANFRAVLRDYQLEGYRWLARLAEWGAGACLADDMGLGKTIQALAILVRRAGLGPALVVAPTSVCQNWLDETARFAPSLRMSQLREDGRDRQAAGLGPGDVLIASYSLLHREEKLFAGIKWATAVLDEAQAIKNFATKRSRAAMSLDAGFRLITTGTPVENHLGELWNLFHFINPGLLGSLKKFQERFALPIERFRDAEAGERLRRIIRPFVLRRTKNQVLSALPPKTEITLTVELGPRERAFYESLRRSALERLEDGVPRDPGQKSLMILAEIMRLRRACCSPELIDPGIGLESAKQEQFKATLAELIENRHKALVFSQFVDHLSIIRRHLDAAGYSYQYLDGSTPPRQRKKAVDDFQAGKGEIFMLSLKAGGLGLNLTAADYVIHMDPWWNPAVEDQASDRAHRIGQDKPVTVYRLVTAGTIEEKIVRLHRDKRELADNLLAGADQSARLDMEEMMRLLRDE
jgi:superfamily II DNA or RNA helicase